MKPNVPSPASPEDDDQAFEQALEEAERSLQALKDRYIQVKADQQRQQELQQRLSQTQRQLKRGRDSQLSAEVKRIKQQLDDLELALESQLFSWSGLKEVFWQAVRFGGIGVLLGWMLKSCAG